ncbi:MAG: FxSxx-COOH system tetratricopeptide repeat protein, partial [Acidimicrobiales bacterium]
MAAPGDGTGPGKQRPDFFVSYTGPDVAWAEWIAWQLETAGYRVLIQAWDFGAGSDFVAEMRGATARAERTLAVLSPAYVASGLAIAEWNAAFAADPIGRARKLVPVRVVDFVPEGLDATRVYVDLVGLGETAAKERLLAAVRSGRAKPTTAPPFPHAPVGPAPFPGHVPAIWNVPARNPNFAGRDDELDKLRTALGGNAVAAVLAVSGLGGVGKTQLVVEHAWRRASDYDLVWWVGAELPAAVPAALTSLAESLGVPTDDLDAVRDLLHAELARRERWLVIFDNAEDPASIGAYLPPAVAGQVLVTSRNPAWRSRGLAVDLDVWPRDEGVAFVLARTGSIDEASAESVAEELGQLPLALEQACAYVEETGMALGTYRDLLIARRSRVLERGTPAFYRNTVATTFGLAYDRAGALSPSAARILEVCAFMAPDDIPTELVATDDPLADEDALRVLRRLALVRRHADSLAVHRLVGDVVRERLEPAMAESRAGDAVAALRRAFPNPPNDHRSWPRWARLLPHVLAAVEHASATAELANLMNAAGIYLGSRAQLRPAAEVLKRALQIFEAAYGPDHPDVAITLGNLGVILQELGNTADAGGHHERALRIFEAAYGPDHRHVARTLDNLGLVFRATGDLGGARGHHERALRIEEAAYGHDHPDVARTLDNLGLVLRDLGDLGGARRYQERALRIYEAAYGPDHPEVARTLGNLGTVLQDLGDVGGALGHQERALRIFEATYGPDHPEVARTFGHLGLLIRDLHDLGGAREYL